VQTEHSFGGGEVEARVLLGRYLQLLGEYSVMPNMLGRGEVEEALRRVVLASDGPTLAISVSSHA
jgi:hypothetical protein